MSDCSPAARRLEGEILRALAELMAAPHPGLEAVATALELGELPSRADHAHLFSLQLVPYASVYLGNGGRIGGRARERISGFWVALELQPPSEPDHLSSLLKLLGAPTSGAETDPETCSALEHRRRALLGEHLLPWLPIYLLRVRQVAHSFYRRWADLLEAALGRETIRLAPPALDCAHWRAAEPLPEANDCTIDDIVSAVLSPVRSGLILMRADLADAARHLGVAARIGERRFMLEAMLRQRPREVLRWLARHVESTAAAYPGNREYAQRIFDRWAGRAGRLQELIETALSRTL